LDFENQLERKGKNEASISKNGSTGYGFAGSTGLCVATEEVETKKRVCSKKKTDIFRQGSS
jgi:hypothetical protein